MTQPPLYSIPGFGPPGAARASWIAGAGGLRLRAALFPAARPRGSVILNTGRTEYIEKYYEVIGELLARRFTVLVHDWRGQGLSQRLLPDRLKGHAKGAKPFLDDLDIVLARHATQAPRPWIAVGHSMGGALTLLHVAERGAKFDAAVLSAPMVGVNLQGHPKALVELSIVGRSLSGGLDDYVSVPTKAPWDEGDFGTNKVTNDPARFRRSLALLQAHHDLALGGATWGWLDFALDASGAIRRQPKALGLRGGLHVVAAGNEVLADTPATVALCKAAPNARCLVAPGAKHEILMELNPTRALFWRMFDEAARGLRV